MTGTADAGPRRLSSTTVVTAVTVAAIDQITKHWALNELADGDIDVFRTLRFHLTFNTGMSFSAGQGLGPLIAVLSLVVIVVLLLSLRREPGSLSDVAVGLIVGGAVGNLIDRLFRGDAWLRGAVVDFIDFQWFPVFNVADICINVGGALLIYSAVRAGRSERRARTTGADEP